mgnify:CR=1 FL=1
MPRNPRYDILFEPVQIGPVRTKNRFFQVPHCNGMGHLMPAAHAANLVDLNVIDRHSGQQLEVYRHRGQFYVVGTPGHRYAVLLRNKSGARVMTVLSVDGINALSGETAATPQSGYVLGAWQTAEIAGWRKSLDDVAAFYFTSIDDSYAGRTDRPQNVGVIGVAVYREAAPSPAVSVAPRAREATASADGKVGAEASAGAPAPASAPASAERGVANEQAATPSRRLGTGHGERLVAPTQYTDFRRASQRPDEIVAIRYDSYANLQAQGVIPRTQPYPAPSPNPFPGGFTPDPPR